MQGLSCSLNRAFPCKMSSFTTTVAVYFTGLAAIDSDMTSFTTPAS